MQILLACTAGAILDFMFGDPRWLYHPVCLIGKWIGFLEKHMLNENDTPARQQMAGTALWVLTVVPSVLIPAVLLWAAEKIYPAAAVILESFWCFQLLAARSLWRESGKVYRCLKVHDTEGARRAVSMIVGRDTASLTEEGITKAAVETVAENTSDGVTAPLLFMLLGGAPLGFFYKAVNTMDSMIGYRNDRYLYFGRTAAKADDAANYIPSRISALFMTAAAFFTGMNARNAWKIYLRDRRKHASPNSAQTESVCAGALGVQLAGDAWYFGELHNKENIGDALRPVEAEDIRRAGYLMYGTEVLMLLVFGGLRFLAVLLLIG